MLRRATCHEVVGVIGGLDYAGPRFVCDGGFSWDGMSGSFLACFVGDEGFVGLEWSAPNVPHEKGSSINQVSVMLWHSLTNCLAALQGKIQETADKLVRVYALHRREVANFPEQHRLKCPESQPQLTQLYQSTRRLCSRSHAQSPSSLQSFSRPVAVVCAVEAEPK